MSPNPCKKIARHRLRCLVASVIALAFIASFACAGQSYLNPPFDLDYSITEWLRAHALPFRDTDLADSTDDLGFLDDMVGSARVVSLGEATHGTHEFQRLRHRVIEYLVTDMGFGMIAVEASDTTLRGVQAYLATGQGDPESLLAPLGALATQEFADLIRWMRRLVADGFANPPRLRGIDVERVSACQTMNDVEAYLITVDETAARSATAAYADFRPYASKADLYAQSSGAEGSQEAQEALLMALDAVHDGLLTRGAEYTAISGDGPYRRAVYDARRVVQLAEIVLAPTGAAVLLRDRFMAENALHLLSELEDGSGMVVCAHNGHVATSLYGMQAALLGDHLRAALGEDLMVVGTSFYDGVFLGFPLGEDGLTALEWQAALPSEKSIEYAFRSTGIPRFALDLRALPGVSGSDETHEATAWMQDRNPFYGLYGTAYRGSMPPVRVVLPEIFDVIFHIQTTTPSEWLGPFR